MRQDLIQSRFGVASHRQYLATWLHHLGFSSQKARLVSDHLNEATRLAGRRTTWPKMFQHARQRHALLRCGAEASFAPWGSLSSPWAPTGEPPDVPTSGTRKGDKGFGLIDSCSGRFCSTGQEGRLNSASSAALLLDVLAQTRRHVVVMQEGARSHTSQAMQDLFKAHAARLTMAQWPAYSPDCNPLEHRWKQVKNEATPLKYFPAFSQLQAEVDRALRHVAQTPSEITVLMARYCETLGAKAASWRTKHFRKVYSSSIAVTTMRFKSCVIFMPCCLAIR